MTETSQRGFEDLSPIKKHDSNKENDLPVLSLIQFSKSPFVAFGTVKLGSSKSSLLRVDNPTEDAVAEVTIDKISSTKGFSTDCNRFTVEPESSFTLTITWTPTEEGGIRELIVFNYGVLKHQAVLLGRAEAPKTKKKSLWDAIKNKRAANPTATPRCRNNESTLKMTANKTFQVPRKPQYKREKPRSPLASLNKAVDIRERPLSKFRSVEDGQEHQPPHKATQRSEVVRVSNQDQVRHAQENTPILVLAPAAELADPSNGSAVPLDLMGTPEHPGLTRVLNRTLSPVGTPEGFKRLMPHIQSLGSLEIEAFPASGNENVGRPPIDSHPQRSAPGVTLSEALAIINSDFYTVSTSNSEIISDSLDSVCGSPRPEPVKLSLGVIPDSPELSDCNGQRCTFFVSKSAIAGQGVVGPAKESVPANQEVKKVAFTSTTVTKSRAVAAVIAAPDVCSPGGRRIRKSRRRLLEKTLDLSEGGGSSSSSSPSVSSPGLPVIELHSGAESWSGPSRTTSSPHAPPTPVIFPIASLPELFPTPATPPRVSFTATPHSPPVPPPPHALPQFPPRISSPASVPLMLNVSAAPSNSWPPAGFPLPPVCSKTSEALPAMTNPAPSPLSLPVASPQQPPPLGQEVLVFPVHTATAQLGPTKSRKRKSDEYMRSGELAGRGGRDKRSRDIAAVARESAKPARQKKWSQRQHDSAGSVRSTSASAMKTRRAVTPAPSQSASRGARSLKAIGTGPARTTKVVAVALTKLTFIKPAQTAIPRHPLPFAAKNMFYDERWLEKQESGFTCWINYILTPDDFKVNLEVTKVNALSIAMGSGDKYSVPKAPTKEELSFSTYTARRRLNRLRRSACQLFTSEAMVKAIQRLELEVEARRLLIRKDRHLWKDIGERQKVLNWLLSYNPLWLRIGLETIYGELIPLESNSDVLGLAMFVLTRLLWNPDIATEFRHAKVPHLYKDGHEEALSRFTLKKLLLLVCFLDKAKEARLIEHDPCLFCMDAEFKTSKDLLLAFSRDFLSGEGILPRHMGYLGLPVSHVQMPLDEFNFAVKNLAVDLKCGIRLVRVMELFLQDWSLSRRLRLPAISRLQKVHNVDIAFQVLKAKGVDLRDEHGSTIDSKDIVDGHREKTMSLLWKIIFAFQVEVILDEEQLREEIGFLKRTLHTKRRLASLRADSGLQESTTRRGPATGPFEASSTKIGLLMAWVNAVCDFYSLRVENFTVSFSDGRVLCYLIHHYHPGSLPEHAISRSTTQTVECSPWGRTELDCCSDSDSESSVNLQSVQKGQESPSFEFKELLEKEKNNFRLVNSAVAFLGGVPAMINPADMSNTIPNEKVVTSYLSFLCSRLLDLRNETRAARVIQDAWRKYRLIKDLELYQQRNVAAAKIQVLVKSFLQRRRTEREKSAAILIQARWRGYAARNALRLKRATQLCALRHNAATIIQAQWKMYSTKRSYQCLRRHVVIVQAQWRMRGAAIAYSKIRSATTVIQTYTRAWAMARRERGKYISIKKAAVEIQRGYRKWRALILAKEHRAATVIQAAFRKWHVDNVTQRVAATLKIQSWYRMRRCALQYLTLRRSATLIQAHFRGHAERCRLQALRLQQHSALVIQSAFRGHAVRKQLAKKRLAAVLLQRWFRACVKRNFERQSFVKLRHAAIIIQAAHRRNAVRVFLREQCCAATVIQAAFRRFAAERRYLALKTATTIIQHWYRAIIVAHKTREDYVFLKCSAVVIQRVWRGRADRKRLERLHEYATLIQASYRRRKAQALYRSIKFAAVVLQRQFRAYIARKIQRAEYLQLKAAAITLQANFRGMKVRVQLNRRHNAATLIQSVGRMLICRKRYLLLQTATIIIQSRYRALVKGRVQQLVYRQQRQAAINIQATYRGLRVRRGLRKRHMAATTIQANFRMYRVHMAYLATRCAAIIVQERFRAKRLGDQQAQKYSAMRSAAVIIQAGYRGHMVREKLSEMHCAATVIQRWFQASMDRRRFLATKATALLFQRTYRAVVQTREIRSDYLLKRRAAISLQAAYKGMKARQQLQALHKAAVTIQSFIRMFLQRTYYKKLHWATTTVQCRYRTNKKMREKMLTLNAQKNAVVVLQAAFRGMKTRQAMKQMHRAASTIQKGYRVHCEHKRYLTLKSSALTLQRRFRANLVAKHQLQQYQQIRRAAILLQAAYRGQQVRKDISCQHRAATVIQASFRKHREQAKFQAMRLSTITIQRFYRSCVLQRADRGHFLKVRQSTIVLQAAFRGHCVRNGISKMQRAATVIQAYYRRYKQQLCFRRRRWAALVVQERFRALRLQSLEVKNYQRIRRATTIIQAAFRGMKTRQAVRRMHKAASVIQRGYRAHCEHKSYLTLKSSALTLQRRFRANLAGKRQLQQYQQMHRAVILFQAAYRGQRARKEISRQHGAATVIQASFRKHRERVKFQAMRLSALIIQRYYRSCVLQRADRVRFLEVRQSVIFLQAAFRGMASRKKAKRMHQAANAIQLAYRAHCDRKMYVALKSSAIKLQQRYRANLAAKHQLQQYQQIRRAAILLQATYRGQQVRKDISCQHRAATVIQASFRKHREQAKFQAMRLSTITIQRFYRSCVLQRADRGHFLKVRQSAIILQAAFRGHCVRNGISKMQRAATFIQAYYRRYKQQLCFRRRRWAALVVQQRFRALRLQSLEVKNYQRIRRATTIIQAAFRGMKTRQAVRRMHKAASVIQRGYRAHCEHKSYLTLKSSALTLQRRFRANLAGKRQLQQYQQMHRAVILFQAAYRGQRARKEISRQHGAATVIQASFRKHRERIKFQAMRLSALIIQRYYRSCVLQRADRVRFLEVRQSVIFLQAAFRGMASRKKTKRMHQAANAIQLAYRAHCDRKMYVALKSSAIKLQQRYRANLAAKHQLQQYQQIRRAAILLQAAYRGQQVRKDISCQHRAATVIQASFRKHREQAKFQAMRLSTITIQRFYRSCVLQRADRGHFLKVRQSAIVLQAAFRGHCVRNGISKMQRAATVIQAYYRRYKQQLCFRRRRWAALVVQQRFRALRLQSLEVKNYQRIRRATTIIQAAFRGMKTRQAVRRMHKAASVIQRGYRAHCEHKSYLTLKSSALTLQRRFRANLAGKRQLQQYQQMHRAVILFQAAYRGQRARKEISRQHGAATVIQASFRKHRERIKFQAMRLSALIIQRYYRSCVLQRADRVRFLEVRQSVIFLQAAFRGMASRKKTKRMHQAANAIQLAYRAHCDRKMYVALKSSAIKLQQRYRANLAAKHQLQQYQQIRRAAILLQAAYRGQQVRKDISCQHRAATVIQASFRKHREQAKFQAMRLSTITIQRFYRSCVLQRADRGHFLKVRQSAIVLQAAFRGHCVRNGISKMQRAATVIQAYYRRYKQQLCFRRRRWAALVVQQRFRALRLQSLEVKNYQRIRRATTIIQAAFRGMKTRQAVRRMHKAASAIQRGYRTHCEHKSYLTLKSSALILQRRFRANLAGKRQLQQYQQMHRAVILFQAVYRGQRVRKEISHQHQAATVIQASFRKHRERVKFQAMRLSVIIIQRYYRSCVLQRADRGHFLEVRRSAIFLQAAFRGHLIRKAMVKQNHAASLIQACWRSLIQRRAFQRLRQAAVTLQRTLRAIWRAREMKQQYTRKRQAVVTLQAHFRGWITRRQLLEAAEVEKRRRFTAAAFHHISAMKIQRALRAQWALQSAKKEIHSVIAIQRWVRAKQQRRRYVEDRRKVLIAQRTARRWLARRHQAALVIQHAARRFLLCRRQQRVQKGIIKAQALWRGHRCRTLSHDPRVAAARHRLRKVSTDVKDEDKLGNKTASALDYLLRYKHFSYILEALKNLETATRLSPECCERLVLSGATLVLFTLIRCCNRSLPCMDVISSSIQILLNLSKYHKTVEAVYAVENSVETLLDLLQRYREKAGCKVTDKGGSIFTKACFLLALLLQDHRWAQEVRNLPKALERIRSIYRLTARKHQMDTERTIIKQKMNASTNGGFSVQTTPHQSRPVRRFAPDWVLKKNKHRDIVDPLGAIKMLAETFLIVL